MVSAREVAQVAVYGGPLEKKGRTGWKKKYFYVTTTQWIYFDSMDATTPTFAISATEIVSVEELQAANATSGDSSHSAPSTSFTNKGFAFNVTVGKKKTELRAATEDDRDGWIGALMPYVADVAPLSATHSHHPKSRSRAELAKVADYIKQQMAVQKKKTSFTTHDVLQALGRKFPDLSDTDLLAWGEALVSAQLLLGPSTAFKDTTTISSLRLPDKLAKKLSASDRSKLSDLMSSPDFDAKAYAESFLKRNPPDKIDSHCHVLLDQKDVIIHELKADICANYTTFLAASTEIRHMENHVSLMRAAIVDCKRALQLLQSRPTCIPAIVSSNHCSATSLESPACPHNSLGEGGVVVHVPGRSPCTAATSALSASHNNNINIEQQRLQDARDDLAHSLDMHLFENDLDAFVHLVVAAKANPDVAEVVASAVDRFVRHVAGVDGAHRDRHVLHLLELDQVVPATALCLDGYARRMVSQVHHVTATGHVEAYVLALSRAVFTTLLMCYQDFLVVFHGHKSGPFVSFTMWMTDQLSHFATQVTLHVFECSPPPPSILSPISPSSVTKDVVEFKAATKTIATCLRKVFYGARQLELAGLPIATYLAPHFQLPLQHYIRSYVKTIKWKTKDEVKRERWELVTMTLRSDDKHKDVAMVKSARVFAGYVQQYLRDMVKLVHPSCASSHLPEIHLSILYESELVVVQYMQDIKAVVDNPKTTTSIKYAQVVSMLLTLQYIEQDIFPRVQEVLQGVCPSSQIEKASFGSKVRSLSDEIASVALVRLAKALVGNSMRWPELHLGQETLPNDGAKSMFVTNVQNDLSTVPPDHLEQIVVLFIVLAISFLYLCMVLCGFGGLMEYLATCRGRR
ncbi:hypothetical protein, variant 1 [Aphanomyces astaci]|uniref:Exocyst complex component 8 n=1 Tax=Aphanomyces astaci TaxID=112090 RepID=W4GCD1_APHAT|nr:hypothetical protein, variant 1 [Aphanomyces astaci]ETV77347.1 hypothetical protein, variant 1 [Aphanomyces astaci]|eukprot:XP_009833134.1 hypothetical protein, variant 1 [Aphanomyces astaci]